MSAEVIAFPERTAEVEPANDDGDGCGPPVGTEAWHCAYCQDDDDAGFAFYITPVDVRCWTCHNPQDF